MTRRWILFGAVAAALTLATIATNAQSPRPARFGNWGQIWGTFYFLTTYPNGNVIPTLATYHADGTISGADGLMFGAMPSITTRITSFQGVWERTGFQSVGGTSYYMIFNATGGLLALGRVRASLQFADDFNSFEGKMFADTLPCTQGPPVTCPDPFDPAAPWVNALPTMPADGFPVKAVRISRMAAGPLR